MLSVERVWRRSIPERYGPFNFLALIRVLGSQDSEFSSRQIAAFARLPDVFWRQRGVRQRSMNLMAGVSLSGLVEKFEMTGCGSMASVAVPNSGVEPLWFGIDVSETPGLFAR